MVRSTLSARLPVNCGGAGRSNTPAAEVTTSSGNLTVNERQARDSICARSWPHHEQGFSGAVSQRDAGDAAHGSGRPGRQKSAHACGREERHVIHFEAGCVDWLELAFVAVREVFARSLLPTPPANHRAQ